MTDPHLQIELQRLENTVAEMKQRSETQLQHLEDALDQITRRWEAAQDIARAAEHLYWIIREKASYTQGGTFGAAVTNLGQAIRNAHDLDGGGR